MRSLFIGKVDLKVSIKYGRYLNGVHDKSPILGFEDRKIKDVYHLSENMKKAIWMVTHDSKQDEIISQIEPTRFINKGKIELITSGKTGKRYFRGLVSKVPVLGFEDLKTRNRFHLVIDHKRINFLVNQDKKVAEKVEVVPVDE